MHGFSWSYAGFVALGILLAGIAAHFQRPTPGLDAHRRRPLQLFALGGAILGAWFLQLPADLFGWSAPPEELAGLPAGARPIGGRTVLGGLLGGWIAVEGGKRLMRFRGPTGDAFAAPLAIALCCGRLGCWFTGCCAGVRCDATWWSLADAAGTPRIPVQAIEALFHGLAAVVLLLADRRDWQRGRRLAVYVASYALLRLVLEEWRPHPEIASLGLSFYQLLSLALFALAGGTWLARHPHSATQNLS